jgi:hypothetical protein
MSISTFPSVFSCCVDPYNNQAFAGSHISGCPANKNVDDDRQKCIDAASSREGWDERVVFRRFGSH